MDTEGNCCIWIRQSGANQPAGRGTGEGETGQGRVLSFEFGGHKWGISLEWSDILTYQGYHASLFKFLFFVLLRVRTFEIFLVFLAICCDFSHRYPLQNGIIHARSWHSRAAAWAAAAGRRFQCSRSAAATAAAIDKEARPRAQEGEIHRFKYFCSKVFFFFFLKGKGVSNLQAAALSEKKSASSNPQACSSVDIVEEEAVASPMDQLLAMVEQVLNDRLRSYRSHSHD